MGAKLTKEILQQRLDEHAPDEFDIIDDYKGTKTKITFFHYKCNREFQETPDVFMRSYHCPLCSREHATELICKFSHENRLLSTEEVASRITDATNGEYELVGEYVNSTIPFKVLHKECGNVFTTYLNNFLRPNGERGNRCRCESGNMGFVRTYEQFLKEFNAQPDSEEYDIVGKYTNYTTKIDLLHKKCNKIWSVTPSEFLQGTRCLYCNRYGEGNRSWNGGVSSVNEAFRKNIKEWYIASASLYNNRCLISGEEGTNKLTVHHTFKNFSEIRDEVLTKYPEVAFNNSLKDIAPLSKEQNILKNICDEILAKHYDYGYGVVLTRELHKEFHSIYGKQNNTLKQFLEFAKDKGTELEVAYDKKGIRYLIRKDERLDSLCSQILFIAKQQDAQELNSEM